MVKMISKGHKGRLIPKQARQLNQSIKAPPSTGAHDRPTLCAVPDQVNHEDRLWTGNRWVIKAMVELSIALTPSPHMARPMMNILDDWASVQSKDPETKTVRPAKTTDLGENTVQILPKLDFQRISV